MKPIKLPYSFDFNSVLIKKIEADTDCLKVVTSEGTAIFTSFHSQDCCENVYADFEVLKDYVKRLKATKDLRSISIKAVDGMGFLLCFYYAGYSSRDAVKGFIPCYNFQNGYYSSNLELVVQIDKRESTRLEISECVEDHIN